MQTGGQADERNERSGPGIRKQGVVESGASWRAHRKSSHSDPAVHCYKGIQLQCSHIFCFFPNIYESLVFVGKVPIFKFYNLFKKFKIQSERVLWEANRTYLKIQFGLTSALKDNAHLALYTYAYKVRRSLFKTWIHHLPAMWP